MTRKELINIVKTKVDELSPVDAEIQFINPMEDKPIDSFVDNLLDECAKEVLQKAPVSRLDGVSENVEVHANKDGSGYIVLPDNFIRLLEFKMAGWKRAVVSVAEPGSEIALKQSNRFLRGGCCKPVCVFSHRPEGRVMEYYSVQKKHEVDRFIYVKFIKAEELSWGLQDVLTWWCASRVFEIVGKLEEAKFAYERGGSLL